MKVLKLDELPFSRIAHKFVATGDGQLRVTSIQPSSSFATEWLDE